MGDHYADQREADDHRQLEQEAERAGMEIEDYLIFKQEPIFQFFGYKHLRSEELQVVSSKFSNLARGLIIEVPRNPERTVALRKLLEAKDAAVRAAIYK